MGNSENKVLTDNKVSANDLTDDRAPDEFVKLADAPEHKSIQLPNRIKVRKRTKLKFDS